MGRGTVPVLPEELRRLIWVLAVYPLPRVWCSVCAEVVVLKLEDGSHQLINTHSLLWCETPRCMSCAGHPVWV